MAINVTGAIGAYRQAAAAAGQPGMEARATVPGKSFKDLMSEVGDTVVQATRESEQMTAKAMTGKADMNEVVMAVTNADLALQTVVGIRDRVIQAYQEILRMPI
jgi:flagellar hook-basal body complex protein FliE